MVFQIKILDCVISCPLQQRTICTPYSGGAPSSPLKEDQKHYLKAYISQETKGHPSLFERCPFYSEAKVKSQ